MFLKLLRPVSGFPYETTEYDDMQFTRDLSILLSMREFINCLCSTQTKKEVPQC